MKSLEKMLVENILSFKQRSRKIGPLYSGPGHPCPSINERSYSGPGYPCPS